MEGDGASPIGIIIHSISKIVPFVETISSWISISLISQIDCLTCVHWTYDRSLVQMDPLLCIVVGVCFVLILYLHFLLLPQYLVSALQSLFDCMYGDEVIYFFMKSGKRNTDTGNAYVSLTIDDSPTNSTMEILDVLKKYDVKCTFFIISSLVEGREKIMDRIIQEGHEIANHLKYDEASWKLSKDVFASQLLEWERNLEPWIKKQNDGFKRNNVHNKKWFRPGQGVFTSSMVETLKDNRYQLLYPLRYGSYK